MKDKFPEPTHYGYIESVAERQYIGHAGANADLRLNLIDKFVIDGRNFRHEMIDKLDLDLPPNGTVLDVGCGSGYMLSILRKDRNYTGPAIGVDVDETTLWRAEHNLEVNKLRPVVLVIGDMCNLDFEDNSIDRAISSFAVHHAPDPKKAIHELWRVLKPGGQLIISANSINQKEKHHELLELVTRILTDEWPYKPPERFATRFNTQNSTSYLRQFFDIEEVVNQQSELRFYNNGDLDELKASLVTYSSEFIPPMLGSTLDRAMSWLFEITVKPEIEAKGYITENIDRAFSVCRKKTEISPE